MKRIAIALAVAALAACALHVQYRSAAARLESAVAILNPNQTPTVR